ncbi:MAG: hypothetical protein LC808_18690, partial [Actinobacteria bacterium]|nr:hypothetical protein [Actinomycetota bacterium]
ELTGTLWFVDPDTRSWASLHYQPDTPTYPVHQSGPRNLFDEIEAATTGGRPPDDPAPTSGASPSPRRPTGHPDRDHLMTTLARARKLSPMRVDIPRCVDHRGGGVDERCRPPHGGEGSGTPLDGCEPLGAD